MSKHKGSPAGPTKPNMYGHTPHTTSAALPSTKNACPDKPRICIAWLGNNRTTIAKQEQNFYGHTHELHMSAREQKVRGHTNAAMYGQTKQKMYGRTKQKMYGHTKTENVWPYKKVWPYKNRKCMAGQNSKCMAIQNTKCRGAREKRMETHLGATNPPEILECCEQNAHPYEN